MTIVEDLKEDPNTLLLVQTTQFGTIKSISNVLKNTTNDFGLRFDESGIHLISVEANDIVATIDMFLDRSKFDEYMVKNYIEFSVYPEYFFKTIKSFRNDSMITFYIQKEEDEEDDMWHTLQILNQQNKDDYGTIQKLAVHDVGPRLENRNYPPYDVRIIANCESSQGTTIQEIIKQQKVTETSFVQFEYIDSYFIIKSEGNVFDSITTCTKGNDTIVDIQHPNNNSENSNGPISGKYNLNFLESAFKSSEMSKKVHIEMRNNYPLRIIFSAGVLGDIKFTLVEKEEN